METNREAAFHYSFDKFLVHYDREYYIDGSIFVFGEEGAFVKKNK
jgi:hypothetical protein